MHTVYAYPCLPEVDKVAETVQVETEGSADALLVLIKCTWRVDPSVAAVEAATMQTAQPIHRMMYTMMFKEMHHVLSIMLLSIPDVLVPRSLSRQFRLRDRSRPYPHRCRHRALRL